MSSGADGISPELLQVRKEEILPHMVRIAQRGLESSYVKAIWMMARVPFIPKIWEYYYTNPKSLRPISLSSLVLKVMEKVTDISIIT